MATRLQIHGAFYYPDERSLKRALADARARLEADHPELAEAVREVWRAAFVQEGLAVQVELSLTRPDGDRDALEAMLGALAERAADGEVEVSGGRREPIHIGPRMVEDEE